MNRDVDAQNILAASPNLDLAAAVEEAAPASQTNTWELFNARQRWTLVFVLFLIASSAAVDRSIIVLLLAPIQKEFHISDTELGLLTGVAFGIFYTILGVPIARYADRGDRRLLITVAVSLWSLFTAACGLAHSFLQLFLLRIGVGVGEAGGTGAPLLSLLYDYFPPKDQAKAISYLNMSALPGLLIGLVAGSYVAQHYGWRITFYAAGLPGVLLAVLAFLALREPRVRGALTVQNTGGENVIDALRALIKKPTFVNIALAQLCFTFVSGGALLFTQLYVIRVLHASLTESGGVTGVLTVVSILIGNVVGGIFATRLSQRDIAWLCRIPGYGLPLAFPFYAASFLMPNLIGYALFSAVGAAIMVGVVPPLYTSLLGVLGASRRATGFTLVQLFANLIGVTSGPVVTGMLSDVLGRSMGSAEGLRWALLISLLAFFPTGWFMLRAARTINADQEA